MSFQGFITLEGTFKGVLLVRDTSATPVNSDALPTFRCYGPDGFMTNGAGTCSFLHSGTITGVANNGAGLARVTSAAHNLTTGTRVTITGVGGATGVNGTHLVTQITANTFDLQASTFGGAYTSGGTFNVTGAYRVEVAATGGNGYEAGESYFVLFTFALSTVQKGDVASFVVT